MTRRIWLLGLFLVVLVARHGFGHSIIGFPAGTVTQSGIAPGCRFYVVHKIPRLAAILAHTLANRSGGRLDDPVVAALSRLLYLG